MRFAPDSDLPLRRKTIFVVFFIAFALYAHTLGHDFAFDDGMEILKNEYVRSPQNIPQIFASSGWTGAGVELPWYRPLTTASYALNYSISGLSPWSYHVVNVLLHALASVLVFGCAVSLRLSMRTGIIAALLFAVHPIHVEVVANISGRKDLLATLFVMLAFLAHRRSQRGWGVCTGLSALAAFCAMLSKEIGVVTLGLLVVADWLLPVVPRQRSGFRWLAGLYGWQLVTLAAYLSIRWIVIGGMTWPEIPFMDNPAAGAPTSVRLLTATAVVGRGLGLLIAPLRLSPDYSHAVIGLVQSVLDPAFWVSVVAVIVPTVLAIRFRRSSAIWLFAIGWYALSLLPASNLLFPVGTIFGERLLYLPSVAFCMATGELAHRYAYRAGALAGWGLIAILVVLFAVRTFTYASFWVNDQTLFTEAVRVYPMSARLQHKLGEVYAEDGRDGEAIEAYERALNLVPDSTETALNLGSLLQRGGRLADAEAVYMGLLEHRPSSVPTLYAMASLLGRSDRLDEAAMIWERILRIDPGHTDSLGDLGSYRFLHGDLIGARDLWESAVAIDPALPTPWYNLGLLYERLGDVASAGRAWRAFLDVAGPEFADQRIEAQQRLEKLENEIHP